MRALRRSVLAFLFIAAASLSAGASAHLGAAPAAHRTVALAGPICPNGTNWDDILHACV